MHFMPSQKKIGLRALPYGPPSARCDARVKLKRRPAISGIYQRENRDCSTTPRDQPSPRKSAAHAAAAMAAFNPNFQQPPQQQFQQQSSGFPHGGDFGVRRPAVPTAASSSNSRSSSLISARTRPGAPNRSRRSMRRTASTSRRRMVSAFYASSQGASFGYDPSGIDEPPLLEELGVDFEDIWSKTKLVLTPSFRAVDERLVEGSDLAGPAVFALLLAGALVLRGKLHFGYVYGFGLSSCVTTYVLLNLMHQDGGVAFGTVVSFLGYCLLPVVLLAAASIVVSSSSVPGQVLGEPGGARVGVPVRGCSRRSCTCGSRAMTYPLSADLLGFVLITSSPLARSPWRGAEGN